MIAGSGFGFGFGLGFRLASCLCLCLCLGVLDGVGGLGVCRLVSFDSYQVHVFFLSPFVGAFIKGLFLLILLLLFLLIFLFSYKILGAQAARLMLISSSYFFIFYIDSKFKHVYHRMDIVSKVHR